MAQCRLPGFEFEPLNHCKVVANFSQNPISSDGCLFQSSRPGN